MFDITGTIYKVGDIVEKYDGTWKYWTTIQNLQDAEKADMLGSDYRVVRGPERTLIS